MAGISPFASTRRSRRRGRKLKKRAKIAFRSSALVLGGVSSSAPLPSLACSRNKPCGSYTASGESWSSIEGTNIAFIWHSLQPCGPPRRHSIYDITIPYFPILPPSFAYLVGSLRPFLLFWLPFPFPLWLLSLRVLQVTTSQLHEPRSSHFTSDKTTRGRFGTKPWLHIARNLASRHTVRLPFSGTRGPCCF